jgi:hypothetical protein
MIKMKTKIEPNSVTCIQVKPILSDDNVNVEKESVSKHDWKYYIKNWAESTTLHGVKYCLATGSIFRRFSNNFNGLCVEITCFITLSVKKCYTTPMNEHIYLTKVCFKYLASSSFISNLYPKQCGVVVLIHRAFDNIYQKCKASKYKFYYKKKLFF